MASEQESKKPSTPSTENLTSPEPVESTPTSKDTITVPVSIPVEKIPEQKKGHTDSLPTPLPTAKHDVTVPVSTPVTTNPDQQSELATENLPIPPAVANAQTTDRVHLPSLAPSLKAASDKAATDDPASPNGAVAHNIEGAANTSGSVGGAEHSTPNTQLTEAEVAALALTCAVCGLVNRPGELACSRCGNILATGGTTRKLSETSEPQTTTSWPTGEVIVTDQEPIILEIGDKQITVPLAEVITIGRSSDIAGDETPGVDLSPFGAGDQGVSRKHIKIKRKNILVYVADLGSLNGTLLNGRRLIPNAERLLRNGDELQLGRLKIKVKF